MALNEGVSSVLKIRFCIEMALANERHFRGCCYLGSST